MKRLFALALALCLLCGATAFATELNSQNTSGTTTLTATIDDAYTLVIPASLPITYGATATALTLEVTNYRLAAGKSLNVAWTSSGKLTAGSAELPYQLLLNGSEATSVNFTAVGTKDLTVSIAEADWNSAAAGSYTGSVTFTASIN